MKIIEISQNSEAWMEIRKGKITGSKLADIVVKRGTGEKKGFYTLMAEIMGISKDDEKPMERGHRLEEEAVGEFVSLTGKSVERTGFCVSDFDDRIALSPDGLIMNGGKYTQAVEIKCLSAESHLEALYTNSIPSEYSYQILQYFIVNDDLETLYFCFYDPRVTKKPFMCIPVTRVEKENDIATYKQYQINKLKEIDDFIKTLK